VGWSRTLPPVSGVASDGEEPTDAALVASARDDPAAFALLYRRYVASVYQYCDRCLGDRDVAEEVTQTIFMRALASLGSCRDRRAFRSWLFAIAHNAISDARGAHRLNVPLDDAAEITAPDASPEEVALGRIEHREITGLLSQLPGEQRACVELRLQGLSDKEIARVLGRSPGAVRTAQYRAVRHLRTLLGVTDRKEGRRVGR
jgi:RNA polymerase sigma-70 factor (ECF subfamily)